MEVSEKDIGDYGELSLLSFVASMHPSESCGSNGLPLTPNSIAILGNAQFLKTFKHKNLCLFLDCLRGKHERVVFVSEHFKCSPSFDDQNWSSSTRSILEALLYLNDRGIIHGNIRLENVLANSKGVVKLAHYGLNHATDYGLLVAFPIGDPRLTPPEFFATGPHEQTSFDSSLSHPNEEDYINSIPPRVYPIFSDNIDIWSLGMLLLTIRLKKPLWGSSNISQIIRKVMSFLTFEGSVLERIARENDAMDVLDEMPFDLRTFIKTCLEPNPRKRPCARELLESGFFNVDVKKWSEMSVFPTMRLRCKDYILPSENGFDQGKKVKETEEDKEETGLDVLLLKEVYYLWKLAGGDIMSELRKNGLMVTIPPVLSLPKIVLGEGHMEGAPKERCSLFDHTFIVLSLKQLSLCLSELCPEEFHVLLMDIESRKATTTDCLNTQNLPLIIKEKDVRYQFSRIILFRRLLQGYPYTNSLLQQEAHIDILPLYRSEIWAALLGIDYDVLSRYNDIDKESWTATDRQIEVDIPRCHQYNNLLASTEGHRKFKRVLKAWVVTNPHYVYWQGLDSLCAPFLYLNFNNEALAFACLTAFIPKYLHGMFLKDNAAVIQEYLAKFSHVQAFHDSTLCNHLRGIGFIPDLYAIPWILTMFAHVFPLHNIFHLWDKLLLWNSSFPLCVAFAILLQLRQRLLLAEFNDCILLFSDLPAIDIEKCVKDSIRVFENTPKSLTYRKYDSPPKSSSKEFQRSNSVRSGGILSHSSSRSSMSNNGSKDDSLDENEDYMKLTTLTLEEIKSESVPRLSGEDLLVLLDSTKEMIFIDVRPFDEYRLGALPNAISIPFESSLDENNQLIPNKESDKLRKNQNYFIAIIYGSRKHMKDVVNFADKLLSLNFDRLCVLHNGVEVLKSHHLLIVPNT
ncbi:TBC domain-containing protein kinase-like protein [Lepeophtheirus salmonis]|uniref:TBC domain-containing protein kinase-like protein n=1 Tax=Lepeophtheirus salmonis TaxID=72036 RepID=UPI001AE6425E|nr:TBC domain-containing protein kinase-like protein isoform X2 [Lepeophtheirus salmonis]